MQELREVIVNGQLIKMTSNDEEVVLAANGHPLLTGTSQKVWEASEGIQPGRNFEKSFRCANCGTLFKESHVRWFRGQAYGIPCGDHKDIASILRRERESHRQAGIGRNE